MRLDFEAEANRFDLSDRRQENNYIDYVNATIIACERPTTPSSVTGHRATTSAWAATART